jgi:hypothetical protein
VSKELLYEFKEVDLEEEDFYDDCPKLLQEARDQMATKLSEVDFVVALNKCADSSLDQMVLWYLKKLWKIAV